MLEYLSDLRLFMEISRCLNLREAGARLGYSPAVVTTRLQRLEQTAGKRLFSRSTRHVSLTEDGANFLPLAQKMLDLTEQMLQQKQTEQDRLNLDGTVRLSAPYSFARLFLQKPLLELSQAHPKLTLDLTLEDHLSNLDRDGIDISFRIRPDRTPDPKIVLEELWKDTRIFVASPDYLNRHGTPKTPQDLRAHCCLTYANQRHWVAYKQKHAIKIDLPQTLSVNMGDYLTLLACSGAGITAKSSWSIAEELADGRLTRILPDYDASPPNGRICAIMPKRDITPLRVRHSLDFLKNAIRAQLNASPSASVQQAHSTSTPPDIFQ